MLPSLWEYKANKLHLAINKQGTLLKVRRQQLSVVMLARETEHPENVEHVQAYSPGTVDKHRP